jgi:hypothetical protein
MSDPIADALLSDLDTRRDAHLLKRSLDELLNAAERDEHAVLIATALAFQDACEFAELDPFDTLVQVLDKFPEGEVNIDDDPARGQFVHRGGYA